MNLKLYFDGACEPRNPGGIAVAAWWLERDGNVAKAGRREICRGPGATNNVAEWCALGLGLRHIADTYTGIPIEELTIYGDSQLVINQLNDEWRCNDSRLRGFRDRCNVLLENIGCKWSAVWIPREKNTFADHLTKLAYQEATGRQMPDRRRTKA